MSADDHERLVNDIMDGDSDVDQPKIQPGNTTYVESVSEGSYRAFIRGFPSEYRVGDKLEPVTQDVIFEFFCSRGIKAIDDIIINPKRDASRTILVTVVFSNSSGLAEAIKETGTMFDGCKIDIKIDKPRRTEGYGYGGPRKEYRSEYTRSHVPTIGTFGRGTFGQDIKTTMPGESGSGVRGPAGGRSAFAPAIQPYRAHQDTFGSGVFTRSTKPATSISSGGSEVSIPRKPKEDPFAGAKAADTSGLYSTSTMEVRERPMRGKVEEKPDFSGVRDPSKKIPQPQPQQQHPSTYEGRTSRYEAGAKQAPQKTYNEKVREEDDGWKKGNYSDKPQQTKTKYGQVRTGEPTNRSSGYGTFGKDKK
eukprot:gnl/Chilomastix_caulleri/319.p1 GENE.gnl/Chilomastix_caulleri/319~~gnl/Chilomastix_caulleri/319.p1  ORF type:complete len:363 (+),score=115.88 gnl/Chilomastix_caulleri/319:121-1209(+)